MLVFSGVYRRVTPRKTRDGVRHLRSEPTGGVDTDERGCDAYDHDVAGCRLGMRNNRNRGSNSPNRNRRVRMRRLASGSCVLIVVTAVI